MTVYGTSVQNEYSTKVFKQGITQTELYQKWYNSVTFFIYGSYVPISITNLSKVDMSGF